MSLQEKIQALQSLADQLVPAMERDKEEMVAKANVVDALVKKCKICYGRKEFARDRIVLAYTQVVVRYTWAADTRGLHLQGTLYVPGQTYGAAEVVDVERSELLEFDKLPVALAHSALVALDTFVEAYTKQVEALLAPPPNYSAPEGAR